MSARNPAILTEVFSDFHQSARANSGIVSELDRRRLLPRSFQLMFTHNPTIESYITRNLFC
jgi:hypothetical protein